MQRKIVVPVVVVVLIIAGYFALFHRPEKPVPPPVPAEKPQVSNLDFTLNLIRTSPDFVEVYDFSPEKPVDGGTAAALQAHAQKVRDAAAADPDAEAGKRTVYVLDRALNDAHFTAASVAYQQVLDMHDPAKLAALCKAAPAAEIAARLKEMVDAARENLKLSGWNHVRLMSVFGFRETSPELDPAKDGGDGDHVHDAGEVESFAVAEFDAVVAAAQRDVAALKGCKAAEASQP